MSISIAGEAPVAVSGPKIFGVPRTTALLIIATGVLAAVSLTLLFMFLGSQSVSERNARLLRTVTSPDARSEKLTTTPGYQGEGRVYYRDGVPTMLVVLSGLPKEPESLHYVLWTMKNGQSLTFELPRFDATGVARVTIEALDPGGVDQVALHLENYDARVPTGPLVMSWKHG